MSADATVTTMCALWTMICPLPRGAPEITERLSSNSLSSQSDLALKRGWPRTTGHEPSGFIGKTSLEIAENRAVHGAPGPPPPGRLPQRRLAWRVSRPGGRVAPEARILQSHPFCDPDRGADTLLPSHPSSADGTEEHPSGSCVVSPNRQTALGSPSPRTTEITAFRHSRYPQAVPLCTGG